MQNRRQPRFRLRHGRWRNHLSACVAALGVSMPIAAETTDMDVARVLPTVLETAQGLRNLI